MTAMGAMHALTLGNLPPVILAAAIPAPGLIIEADANVVKVDFKKGRASRCSVFQRPAQVSASPAWREIANKRLSNLRRFQDGWDGPGSVAISPTLISKANSALDIAFRGVTHPAPPSAVPVADGSIQLEWWLSDVRAELYLPILGSPEIWIQDRESGSEFEAEGSQAFSLFMKWARRLTADKLAVPA